MDHHKVPPNDILAILRCQAGEILECATAKSAQHFVWILTIQPNPKATATWMDGLNRGGNRLVVRIWHGQSRWWNLNQADDTIIEKELWGYQTAREALQYNTTPMIRIPRVLHHGQTNTGQPYAILEFVGEGSNLFTTDMPMDTSWADSMVKVRHEFGFDEPHPRWGRVPVPQAMEYALLVMDQVIIPIHRHCAEKKQCEPIMTFEAMLAKQHSKFSSYIDLDIDHDRQMKRAVQTLKKAYEVDHHIPKALPPVLVHVDLQPQNIIFGRQTNNRVYQVRSVLDWEEAAWADPRFELLLLGRKVCANRDQAEAVWAHYQQQTGIVLGPITPWLRLETMHSLTTLLLQATANGGRSPWEAKPDLWGKIERELVRLEGYGD